MAQRDPSQFGPNVWLIEEMYRRYTEDPSSVGEAWQEFFRDYRPQPDHGRAPAAVAGAPPAPRTAAGTAPEPPESAGPGESPAASPAPAPPAEAAAEEVAELRGTDAVIARRMEESLGVPTATSVRVIPAKLLEVNRNILNNHLARTQGGKVSFTHLIGWAVVKALAKAPDMLSTYRVSGGKPQVVRHPHLNLGLAVDVRREDGSRTLLVPNIKAADTLDFAGFFAAYEELIRKTNAGELSPDDFAGTTVTITNPGMIGTVQSVPRLMAGQAAIVGVGSIGYPAEYRGADPQTLAGIGVGKVVTVTSTYDHRVIQGALSGEFLGHLERFLLGEQGFYDEVFAAMGVPYVAVQWREDVNPALDTVEAEEKQGRVMQLINMYRVRGHLIADLDPLEAKPPEMHPELDPAAYGLTIWDLDRTFLSGGLAGRRRMRLGEILGILRDAYCRTASVEYMHISDPDQKRWIQERVEGMPPPLSPEDQRRILHKLNQAEALETFLHRKYVGHKRFSLEGAESLIPMLDAVLEGAANAGLAEAVVGMSHRGRLNVLANIIGRSYREIFREFEGDIDPTSAQGSGDVKYHLGAEGLYTGRGGREIAVTLASNPSHLESVDPVVEGMARAKQDLLERSGEAPVLPLLIHGDAAFAGQGVVAETLNLSQLKGYRTGGTIHIIVNNQLGFTTGSDYGRSSAYASDVAKMVQAPIFHVNGDDPEACVGVARLAFEFRQAFRKDVAIDMWCYRRWGHNEADEPAFTQPLMYARIEGRRSVRKLYTETLVNRGDLTVEEAEGALEEFRESLQLAFDETKEASEVSRGKFLTPADALPPIETGVVRATLDEILQAITTVPERFDPHPKLARWLEGRGAALGKDAVDWSLGEALAIGTLLREGVTVRLSGQDTRRGTFSQRHSVLVDQKTGEEYTPLAHIPGAQGKFFVYDSLLSEFAALGFEYGYSVADPKALVMWEAQFGDFVNGAEIIVDQFVVAGEDKWAQASGLVLLLPHGFEGQGPEHSSARLERFLQMAAEDNIRVAAPSTPAHFFHLLRFQAHQPVRRPLVVMTPKSFLRLPAARSAADEFEAGHFRPVLPDPNTPSGAARVILCAGKVYYDLLEHRRQNGWTGVALVRVEQLYPFPRDALREQLEAHPGAEVVWVQEEPENMGAWQFMFTRCLASLDLRLAGVFREESASPATGSAAAHQWEQARLLDQAFAGFGATVRR